MAVRETRQGSEPRVEAAFSHAAISSPLLTGLGQRFAPDGGRCPRAKRGKGSGSDLDSRVAGATIIQVQGRKGRRRSFLRNFARLPDPLVVRSFVPRNLSTFKRSAPFITILDGAAITIFSVRQHLQPFAHLAEMLADLMTA
jgi:hypothetical protein